jgi:hypothetical protein
MIFKRRRRCWNIVNGLLQLLFVIYGNGLLHKIAEVWYRLGAAAVFLLFSSIIDHEISAVDVFQLFLPFGLPAGSW